MSNLQKKLLTAGVEQNVISGPFTLEDVRADYSRCVYIEGEGKLVVFYGDPTTGKFYGVVGTVSSYNIRFGTPVLFYTNNNLEAVIWDAAVDDEGNILVTFQYSSTTILRSYGVVATVAGSTLSFGTVQTLYGGASTDSKLLYVADDDWFLCPRIGADSRIVAFTISGTVISTIQGNNFTTISVGYPTSLVYNETLGQAYLSMQRTSYETVMYYVWKHSLDYPFASGQTIVYTGAADEYTHAMYSNEADAEIVHFIIDETATEAYFNACEVDATTITAGTNTSYDTGANTYLSVHNVGDYVVQLIGSDPAQARVENLTIASDSVTVDDTTDVGDMETSTDHTDAVACEQFGTLIIVNRNADLELEAYIYDPQLA